MSLKTGRFQAMNCPCEVIVDSEDDGLARSLHIIVETEARRVEQKFSRYLPDNVIHTINASAGSETRVDPETAQMLDFANRCFSLSDGLLDVTTGVLRHVWNFGDSFEFPPPKAVERVRRLVGWEKVKWISPVLQLRPGMEIDFGGIGKEYAVDRALALVRERVKDVPVLVNFGGDVLTDGPRRGGLPWTVGIESIAREGSLSRVIELFQGAVATSGDTKKFRIHEGRRYGHILNPKTGYPVEDPPRSVTVTGATCTEAGFLSTLGILHGKNAESFLKESGARFWCARD